MQPSIRFLVLYKARGVGVKEAVREDKGHRHGASNNHDLPDDFAVVQGSSKLSELKKRGVSRRILVVDDNETARISLAILLEVMGHTVATAQNGIKALQRVTDFRPEVILLDLVMPGLSGYEVARRVRELPALRHVMLIAVTGWGQDDCNLTGEGIFDYYFLKPVDAGALEKVLTSTSHC
jgi:CheY-like chemotaxis protein